MAKMEELKNLIKEVVNTFILLFISYKTSNDAITEIPTNLKKMYIKTEILGLLATIIGLTFAFLLKITNALIEEKFIILGIICFSLYYSQRLVQDGVDLKLCEKHDQIRELEENELILRASIILGRTSNKVLKFDEKNKIFKIMPNETVYNTVNRYLSTLWELKIKYIFRIIEVLSIFAMLITAIITNTLISTEIFVPFIILFSTLVCICKAYSSIHRNTFNEAERENNNKQNVIVSDLKRIPFIVKKDIDMRIAKLQEITTATKKALREFHKKRNSSWLFTTTIEMLSQWGIIIVYFSQIDFSTVTLGTIAELTANLVIVETVLSRIESLMRVLDSNNENIQKIRIEETDMQLILQTFHNENYKTHETKSITNLQIPTFSIKYMEDSKNDKPFTLLSNNELDISVGDVIILEGCSGSGKSTFMKFLTGEIRLDKSTEIQTFGRSLRFDETMTFGSLSIYEELFCDTSEPNLDKMQKILENLHLWQEIGKNCLNIWQWMKEKQFSRALSNGQKQRLILAKMLYWVDDSIDVLALDESTSGLDETSEPNSIGVDAEKVLEYIIRYANYDKKRLIVISTHQNLDGLTEKLSSEFEFKKLYFSKEGENNIIKKI